MKSVTSGRISARGVDEGERHQLRTIAAAAGPPATSVRIGAERETVWLTAACDSRTCWFHRGEARCGHCSVSTTAGDQSKSKAARIRPSGGGVLPVLYPVALYGIVRQSGRRSGLWCFGFRMPRTLPHRTALSLGKTMDIVRQESESTGDVPASGLHRCQRCMVFGKGCMCVAVNRRGDPERKGLTMRESCGNWVRIRCRRRLVDKGESSGCPPRSRGARQGIRSRESVQSASRHGADACQERRSMGPRRYRPIPPSKRCCWHSIALSRRWRSRMLP